MVSHRVQTLRLALGMRGGVSLAVWIGGGVAELDVLQRATAGRGFYGQLLPAARYRNVEIDVMSGASAGGLNAVLAAACSVGGLPVQAMRDTWLRVGGLRDLLDPPDGSTPIADSDRRSLLSGEYFFAQILRSVESFLAHGVRFEHRLDVFLSATVLGGVCVRIADDPFAPDEARRSDALLHLRHHGLDSVTSDFVGVQAARTLATAARTTASYPFAFEPMCFSVESLPGVLELPADVDSDVFLLDGGVIDNIPVARALSGIPSVPAETPSDRWVMYLQPSPDAPHLHSTFPTDSGDTPGIGSVLRGLFRAVQSESILDDIEVVRRHNVQAEDQWQSWRVAVETLPPHPPAPSSRNAQHFDAVRIYSLLVDAPAEMVWRPIGIRVPPSNLDALTGSAREAIRRQIDSAVAQLEWPARPFAGPARSATLLIRWALVTEERCPGATECKVRASHVLRLAQLLTVNAEWHTLARLRDLPGVEGAVKTMSDYSHRACRSPSILALLEHLHETSSGALDADGRDAFLSLAGCGFDPVDAVADGVDVEATMWRCLGEIAAELAFMDSDATALGPATAELRSRLRSRSHSDWEMTLTELKVSDARRATDYLRYIDERTATVHRGKALGLAGRINYVRAAGSNLSAAAIGPDTFPHSGPRFDSAELRAPKGARSMEARSKLAGSELANFSAFISERWRANDWMWGRLDVAKTVVDVLTAPSRLPSEDRVACDAIRQAVTSPMGGDVHGPWRAELDQLTRELWATYQPTVERELAEETSAGPHERLLMTKRLLVLRRQWEILGEELPAVLSAPLEPDGPRGADVPDSMSEALRRYEDQPRSLSAVWGEGWLTALGIRAAYAYWAATRARSAWGRFIRALLKPIPMTAIGLVLARHRSMLALAIVWNVIAVPNISSWLGWLAWSAGLVATAFLAYVFRPRAGPPTVPRRRSDIVFWLATAMAFGYGLFELISGWRPFAPDSGDATAFELGSLRFRLTLEAIIVPVASGLALWLAWNWARTSWRAAGALLAGVMMAISVVWSSARPLSMTGSADAEDVDGWVKLAFITRPTIVGAAVTVVVVTAFVHAAFRNRWRIANYGR
jgi:patatin-related protein